MSKIKFKEFIETNPVLFAKANSTTDFNSKLVNGSKCWNWNWSLSRGYPTMKYNCKMVKVIRIITKCTPDKVVRHLCDNSNCINPDHLQVGTQKENCRDKCKNGDCKFCPDQSKAGKISWNNPTLKKFECCVKCYYTKCKENNRMTEEEYDQYHRDNTAKSNAKKRLQKQ